MMRAEVTGHAVASWWEAAAVADAFATNAILRRHLLHSMDQIFPPLQPLMFTTTNPISVKKLQKGGASCQAVKVVLGWWVLDTISLPTPHHSVQCLRDIFTT